MTYKIQLWVGAAVLFLYLLIILFAATNYIRVANRRWLRAHEIAFRARLSFAPHERTGVDAAIGELVSDHPVDEPHTPRWQDVLSPSKWIGSCEIARWVRLHEAQRLEVWLLPDRAVQARFARAMGQIDELSAVRQNAWQRRWVDLQNASRTGSSETETAPWRAELSELLAELFNARDSTYNQLVSLYGKAGWLVVAAYLPVLALLIAGYGPVLLAGFLGGLVSRMQRLVYAQGRPTAYGASWVPLFLAPLLGAMVAWAGLHLLALMQGLGVVSLVNVLPTAGDFRLLPPVSVLGLSVLLGFSERFLNQLGEKAEQVVSGSDQQGGSPAAAGSPTSPMTPMADFEVQDSPNAWKRGA
jgi:hypothetical protein